MKITHKEVRVVEKATHSRSAEQMKSKRNTVFRKNRFKEQRPKAHRREGERVAKRPVQQRVYTQLDETLNLEAAQKGQQS